MPNFIIDVSNPAQQLQILSWSPIQTEAYTFDLLPWSREHEFAQLPWIIDNIDDESAISIDPLTILPIPSRHKTTPGAPVLKDQFAAIIDVNHDLRGPDYSYIAIDALLSFYQSKQDAIDKCKKTVTQMDSLLQGFYPRLTSITEAACARLRLLKFSDTNTSNKHMYATFIEHLTDASENVTTHAPAAIPLLQSVRQLPSRTLELNGLRPLPTLLRVPATTPYTARLKTIHAAATRYAYGTEAAVATMETPEATFETYITIKNQTYWYNEMPLKTAPTIEAIVIYESLRYITNVLGYRIIDINYPTLAAIVSAINKYNEDILLLHSCVNSMTGYIESVYEAFVHLQKKFIVPPYHNNNSAPILQIITQVVAVVEEYRTTMTNLFHQFMESKIQYLSTYLETESPTIKPSRWIQTEPDKDNQHRAAPANSLPDPSLV